MVSVQEKKLFNGCLEQIMPFEIKLILYVAAMIAGFRHEEYIFFHGFLNVLLVWSIGSVHGL